MKWIKNIFREIFGLFVDDGAFALAILIWLSLMRWATSHLGSLARYHRNHSLRRTRSHPHRKHHPLRPAQEIKPRKRRYSKYKLSKLLEQSL